MTSGVSLGIGCGSGLATCSNFTGTAFGAEGKVLSAETFTSFFGVYGSMSLSKLLP